MRLSIILLLFAHSAFAFNADDGAKTILTDGTSSDTIAARDYVDGKNQDGWVMTVGSAGGSYTWAAGISFNIGQTWTIQGASASNRPLITTGDTCTITGAAGSGKIITVKDLRFINTGSVDPLLSMEGTTGNVGPNYRLSNCHFTNPNGRSIFCEQYGLIDNCFFAGGSEARIWIRNTAVGWTGTHTFGTTNNVVIEDCKFSNPNTGTVIMSQVLDGDQGMRVIFRYNTITNGNTETHGATSIEEGLQVEVYKNTFYLSGDGGDQADWAIHVWRGGTGVAYSNSVLLASGSTFAGFNYLFKFRAEQPESYPAPRQPGQGLVSNNTLGRVPIYHWDNTAFESAGFSEFSTDEGTMVVNTDYFTNTAKPGYTQLVYPHPARSEAQGGGDGVSYRNKGKSVAKGFGPVF